MTHEGNTRNQILRSTAPVSAVDRPGVIPWALTAGNARYMFRPQSKLRGHLLPIAAT
jgi:hypothetical protein